MGETDSSDGTDDGFIDVLRVCEGDRLGDDDFVSLALLAITSISILVILVLVLLVLLKFLGNAFIIS